MIRKGQATKEKIVTAAVRLLRKRGYSGTTIEDICAESGVKRGNLYFYFRSKEELAREALGFAAQRHLPFFLELMEDEPDPLRQVELMIHGVCGFYTARGGKAT